MRRASRQLKIPEPSEQNSTETTAVVPVQTATGTKYSDNLYSPCITLMKCSKTLFDPLQGHLHAN
jgi:hypothetical protein